MSAWNKINTPTSTQKADIAGTDQVIGSMAYGVTSPGDLWAQMDGSSIPIASAGDLANVLDAYVFAKIAGMDSIAGYAWASSGTVLAVGTTDGRIYTTSDGVTWTLRYTNSASAPINKIKFLNGAFIALAQYNNDVITGNADGTSWTENHQTLSDPIQDVAFGGGVYVGINTQGNNLVASSNDGVTFTAVVGHGITTTMNGIEFAAGLFVILADGTGTQSVYTSADGGTWANHATNLTAAGDGTWYLTHLFVANSIFFAIGSDGSIASSPDGTTWTLVFDGTGGGRVGNLVYANATYVALANGATNNAVITSTDGTTWTAVDTGVEKGGSVPVGIAYGGGTWLFGAGYNFSSTNLTSFTIRAAQGVPANGFAGFVYFGAKFYMIDCGGTVGVSADGVTTAGVKMPYGPGGDSTHYWMKKSAS